jgi:hypothetical protein
MRTVIFLIALSVAPGEYAIAASSRPPNCALGVTWPIEGATNGVAAAAEQPAPSALVEAAATKQNTESTAGLLSEAPDIDQMPVLKHISETGAKILDLGTSHGLRGVIARLGEEFMLLEVAPDGQAVRRSSVRVVRVRTTGDRRKSGDGARFSAWTARDLRP